MSTIYVHDQAALDKALATAKPVDIIACVGSGSFEVLDSASVQASDSASVTASGSASVWAYDSASVRAYDSASVRAYGSANVTALDSASVRAYDSANVTALDSASVTASGSASVWAGRYVAVHVDRRSPYNRPTITGGVLIEVYAPATAAEWCADYGIVPDADGIVTLYKALDDDYATECSRAAGIAYLPGTMPVAPDWDPECGGGLHFAPHPMLALPFHETATRFVACPVRMDEIVVHPNPEHPSKVKAPRVVGPIVEVDRDGKPVAK